MVGVTNSLIVFAQELSGLAGKIFYNSRAIGCFRWHVQFFAILGQALVHCACSDIRMFGHFFHFFAHAFVGFLDMFEKCCLF